LLGCFANEAYAQTHVQGYTRKDGTYVQPHMRSAPDRSYNNNYSTSPNVNPYTGQQGTRTPTLNDRPPSTYQPYGNSHPSNPYGTYAR
jgi:hypothetical protein